MRAGNVTKTGKHPRRLRLPIILDARNRVLGAGKQGPDRIKKLGPGGRYRKLNRRRIYHGDQERRAEYGIFCHSGDVYP